MKSNDYEYTPFEGKSTITEPRKKELIKLLKNQIRKGFIAHYQVLDIGENDDELDFLYDWLDNNDIQIRGINGTISGEIDNYTHIPKMGQSFTPDTLNDDEQERLFWELNSFSEEDIQNKNPRYIEVRHKLIERNMKLAKWVTTWHGITKISMPQEDKNSIAYIGLISAVDHFDPSMGYKFSTYACKAIYRRIIREAYREYGNTKQSIIINEQLEMMKEIKDQMFSSLEREATPQEIADILGVSLSRVEELEMLRSLREHESLDQIESEKHNTESAYNALSDDETIVQADDGIIKDGVYMDEADTLPIGFRLTDRTQDSVTVLQLKTIVQEALSRLNPQEQTVLLHRFGFNDGIPKTLTDIAKVLNLSQSRISQIEIHGLRTLRNTTRFKKLIHFGKEPVNNDSDDYIPGYN